MKYNEMSYKEKTEFAEMLWSWLAGYTDEVISRVLRNIDEVTENPMAMEMLRELHARKMEEQKDYSRSVFTVLDTMASAREVDPNIDLSNYGFSRCDVLTHAKSYNDVLSDWYIRPEYKRAKEVK